jgi:restriction endonuclease S subunit
MIGFAKIASHANLRCDAKYRLFWGEIGDVLFPKSKLKCYPLKLATVDHRVEKLKKGELDAEYELVELEDVEQRTGHILSSTMVTKIKSDKLLFGDADILTTRLRPNLGKTIRNDPSRPLVGSTEWIPIKVRGDRLHPLIVKYYLLAPAYVDNAVRLLSGKEHPRVAESDILSLKVPFFDQETLPDLVARIQKLEREIAIERRKIRPDEDVIDEILCKEFMYPLEEHKTRVRIRHFAKPLAALSVGFTLRGSARYHHPDFQLVVDFFLGIPHTRVKRYIAVPIKLGATAKKSDFIEDGPAYYVHPGATKRQGVVALEDCYQVSQDYYDANRKRAGLRPGDIIINRSGEAHGKVAYFDSTEPAVASDFTMRVRVNADANAHFLWYFFRSVMFQEQIAREIKGASVYNVFPPQVEQMFVVECNRTRQDAIAEKIGGTLAALRDARKSVVTKQMEILALIDAAMMKKPVWDVMGGGCPK